MSRSNPTESLKSPAQRYFEWDAENGNFKYYDKEKKENIAMLPPFKFIVLDELSTVKGFSKQDQCSFWSNEIRDTKKELLTVRVKKGIEMTGTYEQVKEKLGSKGAKYCKSVYIAYFEGKKLVIGNVGFQGASVGPWIDFGGANKVSEIGVQVKKSLEGVVGKVKFKMPIFEPMEISKETNEQACELDKQLQVYLTAYLARNASGDDAGTAMESKSVESKSTKATATQTLDVMDELFGAEDNEEPPF